MNTDAQPGDAQPIEIRASDAERRQVVASLQAASVEGRMSLDEYGSRVERAFAARTRAELEALLNDLPAQASWPTVAPSVASGGSVSNTIAVLGSVGRRGFWRLASVSRVIAILGSCKLDLREVRVSDPVTDMEVFVLLGSVDVLVPPGVEVDIETGVLLGSRNMRMAGSPPASGGPVIRISGAVVLGSLNVRDPAALATEGAREWDAVQ